MQHNIRVTDRKEEKPPYSRIFVVCNKQLRGSDLRERFERFGVIEDLYIPRDRNTGESKGVAYIKYAKTTSAAAAIQEVHMKTFNNENKPTKVMVAVNKNENPAQNETEDRYQRLFIKVHKEVTESEVRQYFSTFGNVESVRLHKDKLTDTCKGLAYVKFQSFFDAAKAYEECDKKYKPVFATPRDDLKRSRNSLDVWNENNINLSTFNGPKYIQNNDRNHHENINNAMIANSQDFNSIAVVCSPQVQQKYIEQLFNVVPGMVQFEYSVDAYNGISRALITYETTNSAAYALEKLNNFEFPSGEIVSVKPNRNPLSKVADDLTNIVNNFKNASNSGTPDLQQLADVIAKASSLIKAATLTTGQTAESHKESSDSCICNVNLPPIKPMLDYSSKVALRLFIICKPRPLPMSILQDVFCRFGDLIHVSTIPNKTFGFAKYASVNSAQEAINTLHGAIVNGVRLKVMEADDKPSRDDEQKLNEKTTQGENTDYDVDSKRMKLDD